MTILRTKNAATQAGGGVGGKLALALLHLVDPLALLVAGGFDRDFIFFEIVPEMKPLIECACHLVTLAISAAVAPSLRRSNSITALFFDPSRASGFCDLTDVHL